MKKFVSGLLFCLLSITGMAQFNFDFTESRSFYKKTPLIKAAGFTREVIVIQQMKDGKLQDSFKIIEYRYNRSGNPVSMYTGSKWNTKSIRDSFEYNQQGKQTVIILTDVDRDTKTTTVVKDSSNTNAVAGPPETESTVDDACTRFEYDSVNRVKKVYFKVRGANEKLRRLIFYDEQHRIQKIDYYPESERVLYTEYIYKGDKLKIFTVTKNDRSCNEKMDFNEQNQLTGRVVDFYVNREWFRNKYHFEYTADGLLEKETKWKDGKTFSIAIHYYYRD